MRHRTYGGVRGRRGDSPPTRSRGEINHQLMVNYRRSKISGGKYFFTIALRDRRSKLLVERIELLREAMRATQLRDAFTLDAIVVLPEHLHAIWQLPEGDSNYSSRWRKIKSYFTRGLIKLGYPIEKNHRGEYLIWQRRFWEHTIRDEKDFERHANYIHYNPVKHGLVKKVQDWPYSSFHRYVKKGVLPESWGECVELNDEEYGE